MRISREFLTYVARALAEKLVAAEVIAVSDRAALVETIHQALTEEFGVEDRINDEARAILAQHAEEMQRLGASYGDAFKKIKAELVRQQKVVL